MRLPKTDELLETPSDDDAQSRRCRTALSIGTFNVFVDDLEPIVLAPLPHRKIRAVDDIGVVERSERDGDHIGEVAAAVMNGGAAFGAEMIGGRLPAVGGAGPFFRHAFDFDAFGRPARLHGKCAAGALLAGEAVADR